MVQWLRMVVPSSAAGGHWFDPWSGNEDSTCHMVWLKKKSFQIFGLSYSIHGVSFPGVGKDE